MRATFVETEWHGRETAHSNSLVIHRFEAHPASVGRLTNEKNGLTYALYFVTTHGKLRNKMTLQRGRGLASFIPLLFVFILLQAALWPLLVKSQLAFESLPYHEHLFLHENAHTVHDAVYGEQLTGLAAAPWSHALSEGALCFINLFVAQQGSILLPENLSALVAALSNELRLIPLADEQHTITTLFFPPPDQPPRS